jgi:integrase
MRVFKRKGLSRYFWYEFTFEGRQIRESSGLTNERDARRAGEIRRTRLAEGRAGIMRRKAIPLFRDFAKEFLETARLEVPKSYVFYQDRVRRLLPWFGATRLDEIKAPAIRAFKESRLKQGRKATTVNRDLGTLRRVLAVAVKMEILQSSPFFARQIEFLPENGCERVISLPEEKRYMESACPLLCDVAIIMLEMGLRPEEVFELHSLNVHLSAQPPYVRIPDGKTPKARRYVPITDKAMPVIHARLTRANSGYLFPLRVGTGVNYERAMTDLHHAHERALKLSGIEPRFRIYDLRHTYGTRAIESGMNPLTLMKLMGHADLKTTQRYVHLSKQHLAEAQKCMEEFRAALEVADAEKRTVANDRATIENAHWKN